MKRTRSIWLLTYKIESGFICLSFYFYVLAASSYVVVPYYIYVFDIKLH